MQRRVPIWNVLHEIAEDVQRKKKKKIEGKKWTNFLGQVLSFKKNGGQDLNGKFRAESTDEKRKTR